MSNNISATNLIVWHMLCGGGKKKTAAFRSQWKQLGGCHALPASPPITTSCTWTYGLSQWKAVEGLDESRKDLSCLIFFIYTKEKFELSKFKEF